LENGRGSAAHAAKFFLFVRRAGEKLAHFVVHRGVGRDKKIPRELCGHLGRTRRRERAERLVRDREPIEGNARA